MKIKTQTSAGKNAEKGPASEVDGEWGRDGNERK